MNDTELDEILDTWKAAPLPETLRARTLSRFAPKEKRRIAPIIRRTLAGLALAAMLLIALQAIPQTMTLLPPPASHPYTVLSEIVHYASDGTSSKMYMSSYNDAYNREVILDRVLPNDPVAQLLIRAELFSARFIDPYMRRAFHRNRLELMEPNAFIGCKDESCRALDNVHLAALSPVAGCAAGNAVGHETVLDYVAVVVRIEDGHYRFTFSLAPDLNCFPLKAMIEEQQAGGSFRIVDTKRALTVRVRP